MIQGAPERPAYTQGQSPLYGNRFASGDRSYNDLAQWWYFFQTDWSGGLKDTLAWLDDAKYFYSTNIDVWSERGAIKLSRKSVQDTDYSGVAAETITCGFQGRVNNNLDIFIGTSDKVSTSKPIVYKNHAGAWSDISSSVMPTNQNFIAHLSDRKQYLWVGTIGNGGGYVLSRWDGTTWVDETSRSNSPMGATFTSKNSRCHKDINGVLYAFIDGADGSSNAYWGLVKTSVTAPSADGDWSSVIAATRTTAVPIACEEFGGNLYYILDYSGYLELWEYNISESINIKIRTFYGSAIPYQYGVGDKLLKNFNGKLVITVPGYDIWEFSSSTLVQTMIRVFNKDLFKVGLASSSFGAMPFLGTGCITCDDKLWWGNLMYDGTTFHYTEKEAADGQNETIKLFATASKTQYQIDAGDFTKLYSLNTVSGGAYKGSPDKNFIIFNNFDLVSGVDKMPYSVQLIFKTMVTGDKIVVEYLPDELTASSSWTVLGNASYAGDGAISSKRLFFPAGTTFKKLWLRVKLESGATSTPALYDFVMDYLPIPSYKKSWTLNINASDSITGLDGKLISDPGRDIRGQLELAWWAKSVLDFQDLDYATTILTSNPLSAGATTVAVSSTVDFPAKGRIHIDDEEIFYTGKTPTTFTGCVRGGRGTKDVAHSKDAVVNNAYKVIVTELSAHVPSMLSDKRLEYTVGLGLREV